MTEDTADSSVVRRDRYSGGPARDFLSSMAADTHIFAADLAVDRAHVTMLAEQGIIPAETAGEIFDALEEIEAAGHEALPDGEDVHEAIETAVIERVGPEGGKMHTGRSRNDEVASCLRFQLRADLLEALDAVIAFRETLLSVAGDNLDTVMPGYTHLQPAQPTTVAHYLASYESAAARDTERLLDAYDRTNRSPLGAAALAGTPFDVDRERTAELLGFDSIVENSLDAVAGRDFLLEALSAIAGLTVTLSGLAEDLIFYANRGYITLDDDYASTSSIMPQKKNPDSLELVRATAGDAAGALQGLMTTIAGLPRAYNRDLQRATPHVWEPVADITEATEVAAGAVGTLDWNEAVLEDAAGEGFSTATGIADRLAMSGLPFRTAHEIVATTAQTLESAGEIDDGAPDDAATIEALAAATEATTGSPLEEFVDREELTALLDPAVSVAARDSRGGPAPSQVEQALADARSEVEADRRAVTKHQAAIDAAEQARMEVDFR
ncbi:argininosuccinate lyase [Halodesulfurarchaeum formicicum]|uniref:Argininosuccinate lyase n=1 Tax=Halodesulfurarchaeum formicicum TaxID=1873524 RepID=A0A1D8S790_9EURY|nr:argininosuccinate lyase [Halodesulfurarchaeum formicicum]AOW81215.1 argininosuccinate lyase [Halodesulfurarchaeum formicicum]